MNSKRFTNVGKLRPNIVESFKNFKESEYIALLLYDQNLNLLNRRQDVVYYLNY